MNREWQIMNEDETTQAEIRRGEAKLATYLQSPGMAYKRGDPIFEARTWFKKYIESDFYKMGLVTHNRETCPFNFAGNVFDSLEEALELVETLYRLGAVKVVIHEYRPGEADTMYVMLPDDLMRVKKVMMASCGADEFSFLDEDDCTLLRCWWD